MAHTAEPDVIDRGRPSDTRAAALRRVAMFHVGRSGSTVLGGMLNQQPSICWMGEIYERVFAVREFAGPIRVNSSFRIDPVRLLRWHLALHRRGVRGFEVKFFHLQFSDVTLTAYIDALRELGVTDFVVLRRRNLLRKVVSSIIAHQTGRFHRSARGQASSRAVRVDVDAVAIDRDVQPLTALLARYDQGFRELDALLADDDPLQLTFEDHIAPDPNIACRLVCERLGVASTVAAPRHGRTNPFPLRDMVTNIDDVEAALRGTAWEWMVTA